MISRLPSLLSPFPLLYISMQSGGRRRLTVDLSLGWAVMEVELHMLLY
jgi:hypothetical protein